MYELTNKGTKTQTDYKGMGHQKTAKQKSTVQKQTRSIDSL